MADFDRQAHWEDVYRTKGDAELSWFQEEPTSSLVLIDRNRVRPARAIDIGGGQSSLAGILLDRGVAEVAVLDISSAAIERAKVRLGERATRVRWIVGDVLEVGDVGLEDLGPVDLWHDRAVFHFLTDPAERARYAATAARAVVPGGALAVSTFAPEGPERCSGLPVHRFDADALEREFAPAFRLVDRAAETHVTPWGKAQPFTCALLRRT